MLQHLGLQYYNVCNVPSKGREKLHKHIVRANGAKCQQLVNVVKGYPDIHCPSISTYLQVKLFKINSYMGGMGGHYPSSAWNNENKAHAFVLNYRYTVLTLDYVPAPPIVPPHDPMCQ